MSDKKHRGGNNNPTHNKTSNSPITEVEYSEEQELLGNNFVVQQIDHSTPQPNTQPLDPWSVDLFGSDFSGVMSEEGWTENTSSNVTLDGNINSVQEVSGEPVLVGQGTYGDITKEHNITRQNYGGMNLHSNSTSTTNRFKEASTENSTYSQENQKRSSVSGGFVEQGGTITGGLGIQTENASEQNATRTVGDTTINQQKGEDTTVYGGWSQSEEGAQYQMGIGLNGEEKKSVVQQTENTTTTVTKGSHHNLSTNVDHSSNGTNGNINLGYGINRNSKEQQRISDTKSITDTVSSHASGTSQIQRNQDGTQNYEVGGTVGGNASKTYESLNGSTHNATTVSGSGEISEDLIITTDGVKSTTGISENIGLSNTKTNIDGNTERSRTLSSNLGGDSVITKQSDGSLTQKHVAELTGGFSHKTVEDTDNHRKKKEHSVQGGVSDTILIDENGTEHILGAKLATDHTTQDVQTTDNQTITTTKGIDLSGDAAHSLTTNNTEVGSALSGSYGKEFTTTLDDSTQITDAITHEASVGGKGTMTPYGLDEDSVSANLGYSVSFGDIVTQNKEDTSSTTENTHKVSVNSALATDTIELKGGYENGETLSAVDKDGTTRKSSDIDKYLVSGKQKKNTNADGKTVTSHNILASLTNTKREEEIEKTDAGDVTNRQDNSRSFNSGYDTGSKKFSLGIGRSEEASVIQADGTKTSSKVADALNIDTTGHADISRKYTHLQSSKKDKSEDGRTTFLTEKGKVQLGAKVGSDVENGERNYNIGSNASYTALSQRVTHKHPATYNKVKGLAFGDRDTNGDDRVRTLQKALNKLDYNIVENGEYDAATLQAVQDLQTSMGLEITAKGEIDDHLAFAMPRVGPLGEGFTATAGYEAGKVEGSVTAKTEFSADQVKVKGTAGAKVTMIGGNAKIELPVHSWTLGGERMAAAVTMGVNASVLAELNGTVEVDVDKGADKFNAGFSGGAEAFVGAKGGAEIGAEFQWLRQSPNVYGEIIRQFATTLPGELDDSLVEALPQDLWPKLAQILVGTRKGKVLYAKAGVDGRAGLGANASFSGGYKDGMVSFSGDMGGAIGLGGGVKTDLGINIVDGTRLGGILGMRGINWISDHLESATSLIDELIDAIQKEIDESIEEEKKSGGFWGGFMRGVDFVGDDLLNLW